jgi:hypothetical protein
MTPADPQPDYRNQRPVPVEDLAALIDGEITDMHRIAQLKDTLQGDTALSAEYEAQRNMKLLLAQLPEAEAPSFMHTRIMAEISAKKRQRHLVWLPKWSAAAAAVAVFGMGYGAALQVASRQAGTVHMLVSESGTAVEAPITAGLPQANLNVIDASAAFSGGQTQFASDVQVNVDGSEDYYQSVYTSSSEVAIPEDADPWLREFIELGNDAHNYSRALRLTHNLAAPDVSQAVMVVDSH